MFIIFVFNRIYLIVNLYNLIFLIRAIFHSHPVKFLKIWQLALVSWHESALLCPPRLLWGIDNLIYSKCSEPLLIQKELTIIIPEWTWCQQCGVGLVRRFSILGQGPASVQFFGVLHLVQGLTWRSYWVDAGQAGIFPTWAGWSDCFILADHGHPWIPPGTTSYRRCWVGPLAFARACLETPTGKCAMGSPHSHVLTWDRSQIFWGAPCLLAALERDQGYL